MKATIHSHRSTGEAYDATQTREDHKNGDVLLVLEEKVVGVTDTWPVAVTDDYGDLHSVADWSMFLDSNYKLAEGTRHAAKLAVLLGYRLDAGLVDALGPSFAIEDAVRVYMILAVDEQGKEKVVHRTQNPAELMTALFELGVQQATLPQETTTIGPEDGAHYEVIVL